MIVQISFRYLREIFLSASSCCQELDLNSRLVGGKKKWTMSNTYGRLLKEVKGAAGVRDPERWEAAAL